MLTGGKYYWGTIRKAVIAFGNLFNNIHIDRRDESGSVIQTLKVPISYSPRNKFIARIESQPNDPEQDFSIVAPRIAFEMSNIEYDSARKISLVQQSKNINSTGSNTVYAPVPYNVNISLYVYSRNQDDGLQIIEQILPYFNPDYNLSLKALPALELVHDLPVILNSVNFEDNYQGDFTARHSIIWTLNFTLKLNFFGPVSRQNIIRKATVNTYTDPSLSNKQQTYNVQLDPINTTPSEDFSYIENFEEF